MAVYEMWSCNHHADPPEEAGHVIPEDDARDKGYVELERLYESEFIPGRKFTERGHVCAECLEEAETHEWLEREGWRPCYDEGRKAIEAAKVALT